MGPEGFGDAGVYKIGDGLAIVQSLDFFPPLVQDPVAFGRIAAANALSDLYAMGARPLTALNIVGFPDDELPIEVLQDILRGGSERVHAAGAVVVGGHSVRDKEITYGLSVTGIVDPDRMLTNSAARPGDALVLTKALGTGFITTALRSDKCPDEALAAALDSMVLLNAAAAEAAVALGASAATDVSGFGLAGHATEMARASGVAVRLDLDRLPLLPGSEALARAGHRTRANESTRSYLGQSMRVAEGAGAGDAAIRLEFLVDPQTSGGLLVAIAPARADDLVARCRETGLASTTIIGSIVDRTDFDVLVT